MFSNIFLFISLLFFGLVTLAINRKKAQRTPTEINNISGLEKNHEKLIEMFPSDLSQRGFFCDEANTIPTNSIVYVILEGEYLHIITQDDMQEKLRIPFKRIVNITTMSRKKFNMSITGTTISNIPTSEIGLFLQFKYDDSDNESASYFLGAWDVASNEYNLSKFRRDRFRSYIDKKVSENQIQAF